MKSLFVGDPHCTPDALPEMWNLIQLIRETAEKHEVDNIVFLGDQYHTHSIVNLAVLGFWERAFDELVNADLHEAPRIIALVGNHDRSGVKGAKDHALMLHKNITVVDKLTVIDNVLYMPYYADHDQFVTDCNSFRHVPVLVCHQTFLGSKYEKGFYAPDGIPAAKIPQMDVISGHIHMPQEIGKVWYPGAPRWRTVSDANTKRAIWVVEFKDDGRVGNRIPVDTSGACTPIYSLMDTPLAPVALPDHKAKIVIDIHGPPDYIEKRKGELEQEGVRIRTFPTQEKVTDVKESDGIPVALKKFVDGFKGKYGTPPEELWQLANERISWLRNR